MLAGKELSMIDALTISVTGILMVFIELVLLAFAVIIISKIVGTFSKNKKQPKKINDIVSTQRGKIPLPETQSRGNIDLINVSQEDAAVIMAIVSNTSGIPLNRLVFNSIKLLEDE